MATKLNENTEVALPLRNIISMVAAASVATWAYFGIIERLNQIGRASCRERVEISVVAV